MKLRKLLLTLLLPILFAGVSIIATNNAFNSDNNVIEVKAATSVDYDNFIEAYDQFRIKYPESICDISKEDCDELLGLYNKLSAEEKLDLNEYKYGEDNFSAAQAITELKKKYYPDKEERDNKGEKISQSTAIIIVVVVSIFGMSAISVLYILKKDKVIE